MPENLARHVEAGSTRARHEKSELAHETLLGYNKPDTFRAGPMIHLSTAAQEGPGLVVFLIDKWYKKVHTRR